MREKILEGYRPKALDLFCGAGGVTCGLQFAGFHVTGVDIEPQPRYCGDEFIQADALTVDLSGFDFIWASPPCQRYCSPTRFNGNHEDYPDLIPAVRGRLMGSGLPYVIENVPGAPLRTTITLCGTQFPSLRVYRHRLFESNLPLLSPPHLPHRWKCARNGVLPQDGEFMTVTGGRHSRAWLEEAKRAMGVPWMGTIREVCEAIPPDFSECIGRQFMDYLSAQKEIAA